ncbi:MAG: LacI family DNA-binding transcriptional regulator [Lachnospiraceae bacterium]|nr:LacI family DNA-binding transcriptional regulator [Lachnospiraceae bacterium]
MDDKNLTIGDIAKELGVSKTTISRAISGKGRIGSETKEKVLQYIEEHNYRPNVIARGLAKSRTYNIGLVIPGDYNVVELPFFQNCMLGISKVASSMDYDVLLTIVSEEDISQLQRVIINRKVDGVILTRTLVKDASIYYLKEMGIPFVTIGSFADDSVVQVDNDHARACKELTEKLLAQGIEKIALIGDSQDYIVTENRLKGFLGAFAQNGKKPVEERIYLDVTQEKQVEEIVEKLLLNKTECIIAMDDFLCSCVLNVLRKKKIAVPKEIKVASFYSSSLLENSILPITSIQFDVKELGEITCKKLLKMIEGEETRPQSLLGYQVCMRESTQMM